MATARSKTHVTYLSIYRFLQQSLFNLLEFGVIKFTMLLSNMKMLANLVWNKLFLSDPPQKFKISIVYFNIFKRNMPNCAITFQGFTTITKLSFFISSTWNYQTQRLERLVDAHSCKDSLNVLKISEFYSTVIFFISFSIGLISILWA